MIIRITNMVTNNIKVVYAAPIIPNLLTIKILSGIANTMLIIEMMFSYLHFFEYAIITLDKPVLSSKTLAVIKTAIIEKSISIFLPVILFNKSRLGRITPTARYVDRHFEFHLNYFASTTVKFEHPG